MKTRFPPPTVEQLERAFRLFQRARPHEWRGSLAAAMADPLRERLLRARAASVVLDDDKRARAQVPVRFQRPDGTWMTRMQLGPRVDQLAISDEGTTTP